MSGWRFGTRRHLAGRLSRRLSLLFLEEGVGSVASKSISSQDPAIRRVLRQAFTGEFKLPLRKNSEGRLELKKADRVAHPPLKIGSPDSTTDQKVNGLIDFCERLLKSLQDGGMIEE